MGIALSCCGRTTATEDSNTLSLRAGVSRGRQILKLMVEVNTLSSDDGPLRWEPYLHGLAPLSLSCIQEGDTYMYEVTASSGDGRAFASNIMVPGTVLRKTSECFVQWRDLEKGGAWGLNFASEPDTIRFLAGCTPPTMSPEAAGLRYTTSSHSLALPAPAAPTAPPTQGDDRNQLGETSFTVNRPLSQGEFSVASGTERLPTPDISVQSLPLEELQLERYTPPPGFDHSSPKTAGNATFEFPTPLLAGTVTVSIGSLSPVRVLGESVPLTDIQEETETENSATDKPADPQNIIATDENLSAPCTQDDFDVPLPNALPPPPPISPPPPQNTSTKSRFSQFLNDIDSSLLEVTSTKRLSLSATLKEEEGPENQVQDRPLVRDPSSHSAISKVGETEDIIDLGELVLEVSELDENNYGSQLRGGTLAGHGVGGASWDEADSDLAQQEGEAGVDRLTPLPPAANIEDDDASPARGSNLKITPSFLRTLIPPQEFSTSGEPLVTEGTEGGGARMQELAKDQDSRRLRNSFAGSKYKVELSPERGYRVGSKTNTSSGSLKSESSDSDKPGGVDLTGEDTMTNSQDDIILPSVTTRKAGWLELKTVLVRKNQTVAMKPKRRWKKYWAAIKGTRLVLYQCSDPTTIPESQPSDMTLDLELSLAHSIHDHMKRDHVFCLSTYNGDTFYLQTSGQSDVEDWIRAIHSAAATSLIQHSSKEESLQRKIEKLNDLIASENQLSKLAELELKTVADYASRSAIVKQLVKFSENIERYSVELYKLRCYVASAHGEETPNPQSLLGHISKTTKTFLSNIGIFSVASLHALVCARDAGTPFSSGYGMRQTSRAKLTSPALSRRFGMNSTKAKTNTGISSKLSGRSKKPNITSHDISGPIPLTPLPIPAIKQEEEMGADEAEKEGSVWMDGSDPGDIWTNVACTLQVKMPNNMVCSIPLRSQMTVRDVLVCCCEKRKLEVADHFLRLRTETYGGEFECDIPNEKELFTQLYSKLTKVELCQKLIHTVILSKPDNKQFGLTLEPSETEGLGRVLVTKVVEGSIADAQDINEGDEVLLINDNLVTNLHWNDIMAAIRAPSISLTLRTNQTEMPLSGVLYSNVLNSLVCPPPPSSDDIITKETLDGLIIPMPSLEDLTKIGEDEADRSTIPTENTVHSQEQIDALIKDTRAISVQVRAWDAMEVEDSQPASKGTPWTSEDRLRKCIGDLLESEQQHLKSMEVLMERYLQPMKKELIVPHDKITALSGNITEIADFENKFLRSLEDAVVPDAQDARTAKVVMAIATVFLCHAEQLQLYSGLCTSHFKARALCEIKDNERLQLFLDARNPGKNPRLTLDSLLGKLILRVSRYPLFLRSMVDNTMEGSEERQHLLDAIESTDRAANYINEMQRVSEMYSSLFDDLLRESGMADYGVCVNVGQLRCHGEVMWLNQKDESLGKAWKKGQGPSVLCFVFNSCLILLQKEKKSRRRGSKTKLTSEVMSDEVKQKVLLPSLLCRVQDLPDSDGVTNMWQLLCKSQQSLPAVSYLLRSSSMEQKATMVHLVRDSIQEQQKLFGTLSGTSTRSPSLCGQSSAAASSNSLLPQQIKTKTNNKFSYHFTPSSTQTL